MRLLGILSVLLLGSCGPLPRTRTACEQVRRLYPTPYGYVPLCPRELARAEFGCEWLEDTNADGRSDMADLQQYCEWGDRGGHVRVIHDGAIEDGAELCIVCSR